MQCSLSVFGMAGVPQQFVATATDKMI